MLLISSIRQAFFSLYLIATFTTALTILHVLPSSPPTPNLYNNKNNQSSLPKPTPYQKTNHPTHSNPNRPSLKIHPIGDSITEGYNEFPTNSYRRFLSCSLTTHFPSTQYIGTTSGGDWPDNAHSGFGGRRIEEISRKADVLIRSGGRNESDLSGKDGANVILIHAGTNDCFQNWAFEDAGLRIEHLLRKIVHFNPRAVVFVATLIPMNDTSMQARVDRYNAWLPDIVRRMEDKGEKVRLVDMSEVVLGDLSDGVHPFAGGYRKMARAWFEAIERAFREGILADVEGVVDGGWSAVPGSGRCEDLEA